MSAVVVIIILLIIYYSNINLSEFLPYVFEFEFFYSSIGYFISLFLTIVYIFKNFAEDFAKPITYIYIYIFSEGCYVFFLLFPGGYPINVTNVFNIPCDIVFEINFLKFIFLIL